MSSRHSSVTTLARRPRDPRKAMSKVQSLRSQLADCLIAEDLTEAIGVLRTTLKATKHQNVSKYSTLEVPDLTSRISAAKLILEYAVGKPSTVLELPDQGDESDTFGGVSQREVIARLKGSGLNLLEIVEAYDASVEGDVEDIDPEEAEQEYEDERVAKSFL